MPSGFIFAVLLFLAADLRQAVLSGDLATTQTILASGFNPNTRDERGGTALHDAVWSGKTDLVRVLLDHGADPNIPHVEGLSTPLHYAAIMGRAGIAAMLLDHGALIKAADRSGSTALHLAAARGYVDVVKLLIARKAPLEMKDRSGATPLDAPTLACVLAWVTGAADAPGSDASAPKGSGTGSSLPDAAGDDGGSE